MENIQRKENKSDEQDFPFPLECLVQEGGKKTKLLSLIWYWEKSEEIEKFSYI